MDMWRCANCGKDNPADRTFCWSCSTPMGESTSPVKPSRVEAPTPVQAPSSQTAPRRQFVNRYLDLYRAANFLVALGNTVKVVGISAGAVILVLFALVGLAASSESGGAFFVMFLIGSVSGVFVGGITFLLGILISAQGQILLAQADGAVHTSPFMSDDEKLTAMSLSV